MSIASVTTTTTSTPSSVTNTSVTGASTDTRITDLSNRLDRFESSIEQQFTALQKQLRGNRPLNSNGPAASSVTPAQRLTNVERYLNSRLGRLSQTVQKRLSTLQTSIDQALSSLGNDSSSTTPATPQAAPLPETSTTPTTATTPTAPTDTATPTEAQSLQTQIHDIEQKLKDHLLTLDSNTTNTLSDLHERLNNALDPVNAAKHHTGDPGHFILKLPDDVQKAIDTPLPPPKPLTEAEKLQQQIDDLQNQIVQHTVPLDDAARNTLTDLHERLNNALDPVNAKKLHTGAPGHYILKLPANVQAAAQTAPATTPVPTEDSTPATTPASSTPAPAPVPAAPTVAQQIQQFEQKLAGQIDTTGQSLISKLDEFEKQIQSQVADFQKQLSPDSATSTPITEDTTGGALNDLLNF